MTTGSIPGGVGLRPVPSSAAGMILEPTTIDENIKKLARNIKKKYNRGILKG